MPIAVTSEVIMTNNSLLQESLHGLELAFEISISILKFFKLDDDIKQIDIFRIIFE